MSSPEYAGFGLIFRNFWTCFHHECWSVSWSCWTFFS